VLIGADDFAWLRMSSLRAKVAKFPGWTIIFRDILLWPAASEVVGGKSGIYGTLPAVGFYMILRDNCEIFKLLKG